MEMEDENFRKMFRQTQNYYILWTIYCEEI